MSDDVSDPISDREVFRPGAVVPFWPSRSPRPVPGVFEPWLPPLAEGPLVFFDPPLAGLSDDEELVL